MLVAPVAITSLTAPLLVGDAPEMDLSDTISGALGGGAADALAGGEPFTLTGAQTRVLREIFADMCSDRRMHRLLQGDVGSGKTLMGLESARRLGRPRLVLGPNTAVQAQWLREWTGFEAPLVAAGVGYGAEKTREARFRQDAEDAARRFETQGSRRFAEGYGSGAARVQFQAKDPRGWREVVWRNAERLVNASSDAERAQVAASIEAYAATWAQAIAALPAPGYGDTRDQYCAQQLG